MIFVLLQPAAQKLKVQAVHISLLLWELANEMKVKSSSLLILTSVLVL